MNLLHTLDKLYFRLLAPLIVIAGLTFLMVKLTMMQTSGLLAGGAGFLTFLVAMTSLLYGRARATTDPTETKERAEIADECLRLTILAAMGLVVTAFAFLVLSESYHPRAGDLFGLGGEKPEYVPMLTSFLCLMFFGVPVFVRVRHVFDTLIASTRQK